MLKDTFQVYLNRLIDLSAKNRSIYLPKLIKSQMVDLRRFNFLHDKDAISYIHDLIAGKKSIPLIKVIHARDKNSNSLSAVLGRMQQSVKLAEEETGEKNLFLGWPFVEGKLINEQLVKCPLICFPVALAKENEIWCLHLKENEPPILNYTFLLAYTHASGIALDKEWLETPLEDFPKDPIAFTTALYRHINEGLNLHFNQTLFEQRLEPFPETNKEEDDDCFQTGMLKLMPYAVLGQFSQKGSYMIDDYEELTEKEGDKTLEELFTDKFAIDPAGLTEGMEDSLYNVFPIDASQEEVLKSVRSGKSVVVEGPPGTGKSQLICNLVTDYTSRGKSVLVVSHKRAALDVVYERLASKGFSSFLGLVHDFRTDRNMLYQKISDQINALDQYRELNMSLDAIQLERSFLKITRSISSLSEYLEEYRSALYNTEECGLPIKELYISGTAKHTGFDLTQYYREFSWDRIDGFFSEFKLYREYALTYQSNHSFWLHRQDFSAFEMGALDRMRETIEETIHLKNSAEKTLLSLMGKSFNYLFIYECYDRKTSFEKLKGLIQNEEEYHQFNFLLEYEAGEFDLLWFSGKIDTFKKLLRDEIEWTLTDEEVELFYSKAIKIKEARSTWLGKIGLIFERKDERAIHQLLKANGLDDDQSGLERLMTRLENRLNVNHQFTLLDSKEWLKMPKKPFDRDEFDRKISSLKDRISARLLIEEIGPLRPFLANSSIDFKSFHQTLEELTGITHLLDYKINVWSQYLTKIQIRHLLTFPDLSMVEGVLHRLPQSFTDLVLFDRMKRNMRSIDLALMTKLVQQYQEWTFEEIKEGFIDGLRQSWIDHIEAKYPILREVSSPKFAHVIDQLTADISDKEDISTFITELKLREKVIDKLEYNRLNNLVTYRELGHQVRKKKKLWPIKKLLGHHHQEVFKLLPCWLASPDTVSAIFPLMQSFDLVVFDESSQCFVEKGLPAMLRGKQVVIAGDSQQLQPSDLYRVRFDTEEEGMEIEVDSLLELTAKYFQKFYLEGHYRSESLSLVHFSNQHFYNNRLSMIPDIELVNTDFCAFKLIKVDGVWEHQTNQKEADEVIRQVQLCLSKYPGETIGVITFNYYQMELIQEMLADVLHVTSLPIKVRNIENVQGDEFDQVIFSIGYARNKAGKFTANFGLLSRKDGGNRLNVAITRARKRITIVTSMLAEDFIVDHLKHDGVKLLNAYLHYVAQIVEGQKVEVHPASVQGFQNSWQLSDVISGEEIEGYRLSGALLSKLYDLTVYKDDRYYGAILTDDRRLYDSHNAKAVFVYHQNLLKSKGWKTHQVNSREFWLKGKELLKDYFAKIKIEKD
ncbi:AAA domain-containing protein [Anditalea andensis]|uniref:DNA helicase n=1 Tax=Anditalea andensis TaxID=1048983 RepID=A0A074KXU0_9BACT|nr:AAA domain-containing protein [Anditalea andensis]KEO74791.1 DNA helicase [Anditalea andensis]